MANFGPRRIKETVEHSYINVYVGFLSIIQGVALSMLAGILPDAMDHISQLDFFPLVFLIENGFVLVIVWHEYLIHSIEVCQIPKWRDSFIQFGLGISEFSMISTITKSPSMNPGEISFDKWFLSIAVACFFGALAYLNLPRQLKESDFDDKQYFKAFRDYERSSVIFLLVWSLVLCILSSLVVILGTSSFFVKLIGCIIVAVIEIAIIIRRLLYWKKHVLVPIDQITLPSDSA